MTYVIARSAEEEHAGPWYREDTVEWVPVRGQATVYKGHDGEPTVGRLRRSGFQNAVLVAEGAT